MLIYADSGFKYPVFVFKLKVSSKLLTPLKIKSLLIFPFYSLYSISDFFRLKIGRGSFFIIDSDSEISLDPGDGVI